MTLKEIEDRLREHKYNVGMLHLADALAAERERIEADPGTGDERCECGNPSGRSDTVDFCCDCGGYKP